MKKVIILGLFALAIYGCVKKEGKTREVYKKDDYTVKVIDSCEYIECDDGFGDYRTYSLTHKGNCRFCKERNTK